MTKTFAERCQLAQQLLPDAQYKAMLTALHADMLAKLAEQPDRQALQAAGTHPAPCARHCEAQAFEIAARGMRRQIAELQAALAEQPAPAAQEEPVAWANPNDLQNFDMKVRTNGGPLHTIPLYTTPQAQPAREPLTWEQRVKIVSNAQRNELDEYDLIEAIEAAHGITKGNT